MPNFTRNADGTLLDYYDLFGVSRTASVSSINAAHRRVAVLHHPNTVISIARETLVNEELRARYNHELTQERLFRGPKKQKDWAETHKQRGTQAPSSNVSTDSYRRPGPPGPCARDPPNRYYAASSGSHNGRPEHSYGATETQIPSRKPHPNPDYGSSFDGPRCRPGFGYVRPANSGATKLPLTDPILLLNGDFIKIGSVLCDWARTTYRCLRDFYNSTNIAHSRRATEVDKEMEAMMIAATGLLMQIFFFTAATYDAIRQRVETMVRNWAAYRASERIFRGEVDEGPYVGQIQDAIGAAEALHRQNLHTAGGIDSLATTAISDLGGMKQAYDFLQRIITSWDDFCVLPKNLREGIRDVFFAAENGTVFMNSWERHGFRSGLAGYPGQELKLRLRKGDRKDDPVVVD